jgi:hypothetical protein
MAAPAGAEYGGRMTSAPTWPRELDPDLLPWLLEESDPAVRAAALQRLVGRPGDDPEVVTARRRAMEVDPIRSMLDAQHPDGWWERPGPGYAPKYRGTVWSLVFLEQLGADPADARIQAAARYVLTWCPTSAGGFGISTKAKQANPPPSMVVHCLNGNLVRALIGLGHLEDPVVEAAVDWAARAITGEGVDRWYASTPGPGFACGANDRQPCAWGAVKELRGLAAIPADRRTPKVQRAVDQGAAFLLSRDPAVADYPMGYGNTTPSRSWFKLGFPSGYVTDVLQVLEVLTELGHARDPRLENAVAWLLAQRDGSGRWTNRYAYQGKTAVDIEPEREPSKWVTLRACTVLAAALAA